MPRDPEKKRQPKLAARLQQLVGHDVLLTLVLDQRDADGDMSNDIPPGRIAEVGEDYVVLRSIAKEDGGAWEMPGEWVMPIRHLYYVLHTVRECAGCLVDEAAHLTR